MEIENQARLYIPTGAIGRAWGITATTERCVLSVAGGDEHIPARRFLSCRWMELPAAIDWMQHIKRRELTVAEMASLMGEARRADQIKIKRGKEPANNVH